MSDHADTIRRVERRYRNEVAEAAHRASERDVSTWLAGVSFQEWFDLVAERQQAIDSLQARNTVIDELQKQLDRQAQRAVDLVQQRQQAIDERDELRESVMHFQEKAIRCEQAIDALRKADERISAIHDAVWNYDGQPHSRLKAEQLVWELARDLMNQEIWKLHDLIRPLLSLGEQEQQ